MARVLGLARSRRDRRPRWLLRGFALLLGLLLCGSLPGIWLGSHFVTRVSERFIRSALSVLLAWAGSKLVFI